MARNTNRFLNLDGAPGWDGIDATGIPGGAPFVNRPPGNAKRGAELWPGARALNGKIDRIRVHDLKFGTDCSGCQDANFCRTPTDSSNWMRNAKGMDIKQAFAARLLIALDVAGVEPKNAERKRYIAALLDISERQAGNYLSGDKMPASEGMIDLAIKLRVNPNWLIAGNGPMRALTPEQSALIEALQALPEVEQKRVFSVSESLISIYTTEKAQAS